MKTKDELFPPPIRTKLFLWATEWDELEEGAGVWENQIADKGDANYGTFTTKEALVFAHDIIDLFLAEANNGKPRSYDMVVFFSDQYNALRLQYDEDYKADITLNKRIERAVAEGILKSPDGYSLAPTADAPASFKTLALF